MFELSHCHSTCVEGYKNHPTSVHNSTNSTTYYNMRCSHFAPTGSNPIMSNAGGADDNIKQKDRCKE